MFPSQEYQPPAPGRLRGHLGSLPASFPTSSHPVDSPPAPFPCQAGIWMGPSRFPVPFPVSRSPPRPSKGLPERGVPIGIALPAPAPSPAALWTPGKFPIFCRRRFPELHFLLRLVPAFPDPHSRGFRDLGIWGFRDSGWWQFLISLGDTGQG